MAGNGIRSIHLWLPNRGDVRRFVLVKVLTALQESLRVMVNFRKRKKNADYWIEYFPFEKIFLTENNNSNSSNATTSILKADPERVGNHGKKPIDKKLLDCLGKFFSKLKHSQIPRDDNLNVFFPELTIHQLIEINKFGLEKRFVDCQLI